MSDVPKAVEKCLRIIEENMEILSNIESDLEDEKEDEIVDNLELHHLYDMTEDVAESVKIKRAETNFIRRKATDF